MRINRKERRARPTYEQRKHGGTADRGQRKESNKGSRYVYTCTTISLTYHVAHRANIILTCELIRVYLVHIYIF